MSAPKPIIFTGDTINGTHVLITDNPICSNCGEEITEGQGAVKDPFGELMHAEC